MRRPRRLSPQEAELWARVAVTVKPLHAGPQDPPPVEEVAARRADGGGKAPAAQRSSASRLADGPPPPKREDRVSPVRPLDRHGLDAGWEKKLARAAVSPDFTLDLHGHTLDSAHLRLDHGLTQALAMGARVVLLITGKPRPSEAADRGGTRGAIRAKVLDWLAAGPHASRIAAVRAAHRKHGGPGALYVVLRRAR